MKYLSFKTIYVVFVILCKLKVKYLVELEVGNG